MNSRQRFLEAIRYGAPDRVPLFPEGIREEVLEAWRYQGLPAVANLSDLFHYDEFEELEPDLEPHPALIPIFRHKGGLEALRRALDPDDPRRLPSHWAGKVHRWRDRQGALFLRVHDGFFLTMGVEGWHSFTETIRLLIDDPEYVHERLAIQAGFAARLAERVLREVAVDGAIFHEPIAGNHGPLISPKMYDEFMLASFEPILEVLERFEVPAIIPITRTYERGCGLETGLPEMLYSGRTGMVHPFTSGALKDSRPMSIVSVPFFKKRWKLFSGL